jgi:hypothetical protein
MRFEHRLGIELLQVPPPQVLPHHSKRWDFQIGSPVRSAFLLIPGLLIIQPFDKEQIGELFNHGKRIGDSCRPECFPDFIDFVFEFAGCSMTYRSS